MTPPVLWLAALWLAAASPASASPATASPAAASSIVASPGTSSAAAAAVRWTTAVPDAGELRLAWLGADGRVHRVSLDRDGRAQPVADAEPATVVPLGSLWKLAVHGRLLETLQAEPPYTCRGADPEEVYCCTPGKSIGRAEALWRSCGRYFEPARLGWHAPDHPANGSDSPANAASGRANPPVTSSTPVPPSALQAANTLDSRSRVALTDWLQWLAQWPRDLRRQAGQDLLPYWLRGPGGDALGQVGSRLRLKTFTVETDAGAGAAPAVIRWGGASGWANDGTPIWMAARGSSPRIVSEWAPRALQWLDRQGIVDPAAGALVKGAGSDPTACVDVDYFADYPVAGIEPPPSKPGSLGRRALQLRFANGQSLEVVSRDDLTWQREPSGTIRIRGRLTLEDYVARVVEREGQGDPAAAGRALAVAARTYLLAHARPGDGCMTIPDSSRTQRVAPRPPAAAARAAAIATEGLVLAGASGHYHHDRARPDVMAWTDAVAEANAGADFVTILRNAYPRAAPTALHDPAASSCTPVPEAAGWLTRQEPRWQRMLAGQAGFRPPSDIQVCRLERGLPRALPELRRVHVAGIQSVEDRLSLTHEYLHLAFAGHPRGQDEGFIERLARALLGLDGLEFRSAL